MQMTIPRYRGELPYLSVRQMIEVDRAMVENFRIDLVRMMENAGRALAHLARARFLGGDPRGKKVVILAGAGGNGGGALVCARRMHAWGADIAVFLTRPPGEFTLIPAKQLEILRHIGVPFAEGLPPPGTPHPNLLVDGLIGYNLKGSPRGAAAELIRWANTQSVPVLALDVPSGVDAETGETRGPSIQASATLTLALPKKGLRAPGAEQHVGELYLADIGVPPSLYSRSPLVLSVGPIFAESDLLRLR
ncbi:MAG: NAD(P)H-hydrate epimerase [Candidatus Deferrimicrobiaceae bacterium]